MEKITLLERLKRYTPSMPVRDALGEIDDYKILNDTEKRNVEIHINCDKLIKKEVIHRFEDELAEAYALSHAKVLMHYPKELFVDSYVKEVIKETCRLGIVANGFLSSYTVLKEGDTFVI